MESLVFLDNSNAPRPLGRGLLLTLEGLRLDIQRSAHRRDLNEMAMAPIGIPWPVHQTTPKILINIEPATALGCRQEAKSGAICVEPWLAGYHAERSDAHRGGASHSIAKITPGSRMRSDTQIQRLADFQQLRPSECPERLTFERHRPPWYTTQQPPWKGRLGEKGRERVADANLRRDLVPHQEDALVGGDLTIHASEKQLERQSDGRQFIQTVSTQMRADEVE